LYNSIFTFIASTYTVRSDRPRPSVALIFHITQESFMRKFFS